MSTYSACVRCSAKWFGDERLDICPRCGSVNILHAQAAPPWKEYSEIARKSPWTMSTLDQESEIKNEAH